MKALLLTAALGSAGLGAAEIGCVKDLQGKPYFPLGVNYAWKNWGMDFADQGWSERFKAIQADLDGMQAKGVRTLRWWVFTDFVSSPLWKGEGTARRCVGLPPGWTEHFLQAVDAAHARGIRLYPVFSSFDLGRKGFRDVVVDKELRQSFIEHAVRPLLKAAGSHPGIFAWDIINEPEWLVRKEDGGDPNAALTQGPITLAELRAYIADMAKEIHAQAKQPVSVGSAGLKWCGWQYDFYSGLGLDFFDVHYYDWMTPWFDIMTIPKSSLAKGNAEYGAKPVIVGESMSQPATQYSGKGAPMDHFHFLQGLIRLGYSGYLPWAWTEKPGMDCARAIDPHFKRALAEMNLPGQGR
jgi:hypothetical protein